jgi:glycosyltransferase involved in cell wall biosynthesis
LTFLHGVKHECMSKWYTAADIVLLPSFASEGTPLSAVEAMSFGKAIVATNIGGLNDLIDSGYTGLLVPPVVGDLALALAKLVINRELAARIGNAAREKAESQLSLSAWQSRVLPFMDRNGWFA